jgi:hypothetical protein
VSDIYAFITPTNGCRTNQTPGLDNCYDPPNRVGISLMRYLGPGWSEDFTSGNSANPPLSDTSVIDLTIGFHSAYSPLRWSWVNGVPSYWLSTVSPLADGEVHVKFSPKTVPVMNSGGCSQIPVSTCDIAQADHEYLEPGMILSMDNTLDPALSGVLFGTSAAFIGSLEAQVPGGQPPVLTYGVAAPHNTAGGTPRNGTFFAFLPSSVLTLFGTSTNAFDSNIFSVARTGDPGPLWCGGATNLERTGVFGPGRWSRRGNLCRDGVCLFCADTPASRLRPWASRGGCALRPDLGAVFYARGLGCRLDCPSLRTSPTTLSAVFGCRRRVGNHGGHFRCLCSQQCDWRAPLGRADGARERCLARASAGDVTRSG